MNEATEVDWDDERAARAALRPLAEAALDELVEAGRVVLRPAIRNGLKRLAHEPEDFIVRRALSRFLGGDDAKTLTTDEQRYVALAGLVVDATVELPERLAETDRLYRRYGGDEDAAEALSAIVHRLPEIEHLRAYVRSSVKRNRGARLASPDPAVVEAARLRPLPLTVTGVDGEEHERRMTRAGVDPGTAVAEQLALDEVLRATEACPACVAKVTDCPDGVDLPWWLRAIRTGRPALQLLELGRSRCPMYVRDEPNAAEQRFSRYGFHASGTLLHVFSAVEDRRGGDPRLIEIGQRNHHKRASDVRNMNRQLTTPEAAMCDEIDHWCGWQLDRLRRRLPIEPSTFPSLEAA